MDTKDQKLGYIVRLVVGGFGTALLVLLALSVYAAWAVNGKYFQNFGWPRIGLGDAFWLIGACYFLLVGWIGKWSLGRR